MLTVGCLHYWTDEPTSQYVENSVFNFLWKYDKNRNMVGHCMRPCDGPRGTCTTKRMADEALKSGKLVIQNASEFMTWTESPTCSMWKVKFMFVPKEVCESTEEIEMLLFIAVNLAIEATLLKEGSCYYNNNISERSYESWRVDFCWENIWGW